MESRGAPRQRQLAICVYLSESVVTSPLARFQNFEDKTISKVIFLWKLNTIVISFLPQWPTLTLKFDLSFRP
jgi:hypothetical protein